MILRNTEIEAGTSFTSKWIAGFIPVSRRYAQLLMERNTRVLCAELYVVGHAMTPRNLCNEYTRGKKSEPEFRSGQAARFNKTHYNQFFSLQSHVREDLVVAHPDQSNVSG
jgi:hypothetical protein